MNTKNVILGMAIATVLLIAAVGSASANGVCVGATTNFSCDPATGLSNVVTESCTLNASMTCNDNTASGLISGASNIVIDGAGYSMTGNRGGGCSVSLGFGVPNEMNPAKHAGIVVGDPNVGNFENVMIKNLEIKNFCTGIAIGHSAFAGVNNIEVRGCKIHDNGENSAAGYVTHGVHMVHVHDSIVTKNDIYSNTGKGCGCGEGGHGIFFYGGDAFQGRDNTITCNNLYNNRRAGFWTKKRMNNCIIAYNNVTGNGQGGIVFRCANTRENDVIYNNVSYNNGSAIYIGGRDNNVSYNTAIGNTNSTTCTGFAENPDFGVGLMNGRPSATNTRIHDNLFCYNEYADIYTPVGSVTGNSIDNTCDTTIDSVGFAGCDFACTGSVSVYYNFDGDEYYSDDPENCVCANAMNTGSCCNPGMFNGSGASQHCAGGVCILEHGTDPSDCDPAYILNWMTYPYSTWENLNWSGPAVMEMCINHYTTSPSQSDLDVYGRDHNHNCNSDLPYVDRYGLQATLNHYLSGIAHYGNHITTDVENALHYICWWQSAGPGAVPAYTNYSNWMAVRGIRTDINPRDGSYYPPYGYTIYGFWINDPNPAGIGENSYKSVNQFTDNYYQAMQDQCDVANGNWVSICEPPEVDAEITLAVSPVRFEKAITPVLAEKMLVVYDDAEQLALENAVNDDEMLKIVEAAINGVNVELVPYDTEFAATFAKTTAGEPMLVTDDGDDYYLVPFNVPVEGKTIKKVPVKIEKVKTEGLKKLERLKFAAENVIIEPIPIEPIKVERTLVVVLVDAEDGSFKEASWVVDPVKYLPVSKVEALELALREISITAKEDLSSLNSKPTIELVYRDVSPYYPDWKITVNGKVFYVGQDGTVSN